jgi:F-box/leucine-rich repeat protein 10/11
MPPNEPSTATPAGGYYNEIAHSSGHANGVAFGAPVHREGRRASPQLSSPAVTYGSPLRSAAPPQTLPSYHLPGGSPIDALSGVVMILQHTMPANVESSRRASHAATSPSTIPPPVSERAPKHASARTLTYTPSERPAKRARSEYLTSPPHGLHQSRPATSHIPGWSYNVEQMADADMRMYQESRAAAPQQAAGGDKMLSDAELLLFFSNVSAHTAQTPPSTAKRWSVSQPSPTELPQQQPDQLHESSSPYGTKHHPSSHQEEIHAPSDAKHVAEPPVQLPDESAGAPVSQTYTPPGEAVEPALQPSTQEGVPAEDSKPKKHQGWPKGKPRGSRGAPSTSKRKRSTPKPKGPPAAASEQLQSTQSFPADRSVIMAFDGTAPAQGAEQLHATSLQSRRHSFSISSPHPTSNNAPSVFHRARSVPLGANQSSAIRTNDLCRPPAKATIEQPDLICAACKSSDSEIKVGDGEQWIGCDGCKEWYHYACAGFSSEREVRDVNKFYCGPCRPKFGETTSRSTDAQRRYNSNLVQRFGNLSESTRRSIMPVSMKASSRRPTTTPSITTSPLSRMET